MCVFLSLLLITVTSASAKRPDLDAVFWGNLTHNDTTPLRPGYLGQIVVSAWVDGVKLAELAVPPSADPNPSRYVIKVPLDDGVDPQLPGTARAGDRVKIRVRNVDLDVEYEVNETENITGLSIPAIKGTVVTQNLSLDQDLGGVLPVMAQFAVWRAEIDFQPDILDPDSDADNDGVSNFDEFLANTDPRSGSAHLHIRQVRRGQGINSLRFGPVKHNRTYQLLASPTLQEGDWQTVAEISPSEDADALWQDHLTLQQPLFYRVEVRLR